MDLTVANTRLIDIIASIRTSYKIKLPDAIIAATAIYKNAVLISNDKDFEKITSLKVINY